MDILDAALHLVVAVADQQAVTMGLRGTFQTDRQLRVKRIQHIGIDQTDGAGLFGDEGYRDLVGNIVQPVCCLENPLSGGIGDAALLAPQHQRDGADGNIRFFGDIPNGGSHSLTTPSVQVK